MYNNYLKKGSLVIIDLDHVFKEGDPSLDRMKLSNLSAKFDKWYNEEKLVEEGLDK